MKDLLFFLCVLCASLVSFLSPRQEPARIALVAEGELGEPGNFGLDELFRTIREKGLDTARTNDFHNAAADLVILAGIPQRVTRLRDLEQSGKISVPANPESYTIRNLKIDSRKVEVVQV